MKHCTNCGKEISNIDKFCAHCGSSINDDTIKANVKVNLTNDTTEKAFNAAGNTISKGKKQVVMGAKVTISIIKKLILLAIILVIIGAVITHVFDISYSDYQEFERKLNITLNNPQEYFFDNKD